MQQACSHMGEFYVLSTSGRLYGWVPGSRKSPAAQNSLLLGGLSPTSASKAM